MSEVKICNVCNTEKPLCEFKKATQNTDGRTRKCKECFKNKRYTEDYLNKPKEGHKFCSICKEEKTLENFYFRNKKDMSYQPCCKPCHSIKNRQDNIKHNKKRVAKKISYNTERSKSDEIFKFKNYLRHTVKRASKKFSEKGSPSPKAEEILGCTLSEFMKYIEDKFQEGMSWANHGHCKQNDCEVWNIDHIVPLKTALSLEEALALNHYTNLQPMWALENLKKGSTIEWQ